MDAARPRAAARLTVDLAALVANWRWLSAQAPGATCAAVVKADAYGLGAEAVARALFDAGCRVFFVALLAEGLAVCRVLPPLATVYVLNGLMPGAEARCAAAGLVPVLNSLEQVAAWQRQARLSGRILPAALQADTGMHRLGLDTAEWQALRRDAASLQGIHLQLLLSHLADAELPASARNRQQLAAFRAFRAAWPAVAASLANSSGILLGADYHFDVLRPGAALYGIHPQPATAGGLQPVVRLQARLVQCRAVPCGDTVGYNGTWRAARDSRIATLAVGYADGYPRALGNQATVALADFRVPLVGRVSMDTVTVDVTDIPQPLLRPGVWFDLLDGHADINVLAAQAGTSAYEILTGLGHRFERVYSRMPLRRRRGNSGRAVCAVAPVPVVA